MDGRSVMTAVGRAQPSGPTTTRPRWGPFAVRRPVSASDVSTEDRHRMPDGPRTRERLPVLPALVSWAAAERGRSAELLAGRRIGPLGAAVHRRRGDAAPGRC